MSGKTPKIMVIISSFLVIICIAFNAGCGGLKRANSGYSWNKESEGEGYNLIDASILDSNHIWAINWTNVDVGDSEIIFHDGNKWERQYLAEDMMITDIFALDEHHVWAAGGRLINGGSTGIIIFFNGTTWESQYEKPGLSGFLSVFASDANHVWATSKGIYFFDGIVWTEQLASQDRLQAVASYGADDSWAASENGSMYHFNGLAWEEQQSLYDTRENVTISYGRMFALDADHVWAGLDDTESLQCKIFSYDGSRWKEQLTAPDDIVITNIHALDDSHVWATGGSGLKISCPILFNDGETWSIQQEYDESLIGIRALDANNVLAVGRGGAIYHGTKGE